MADWRDETEGLALKGQIKMPYTWSVGEVGSRFLVALRDEGKILGNRCPLCGNPTTPHPDPATPNARYCPHCQRAVSTSATSTEV